MANAMLLGAQVALGLVSFGVVLWLVLSVIDVAHAIYYWFMER